jgi:hypothetical protein
VLNSVLNSPLNRDANFFNLLKTLVGPWGLEPQTSTVSRSDEGYEPSLIEPDLFLFTMRCRRVT